MVVQLPGVALATAAGVVFYSFICLICSALTILLVCKHREKDSYVALLAYAAFLGTAAGIVQQLHTLVLWEDVKTEQFHYVRSQLGRPEIALAGPSYGLDLVLFYIQYYCYNVESILTLVWAIALAFSVFSVKERHRRRDIRRRYNVISKAVAVFLPGFIVGLLQIPAVKHSTVSFLVIADFSWALSLTIGSALLLVILGRYIQTRRKMQRWSARYHFRQGSGASSRATERDPVQGNSIYDRWLIVRFIIALLFIEVFQILTILSEIKKLNNNRLENQPAEPDISADRAQEDFTGFLPGVSIGLLVFVVFGTTKTCRHTLYDSFVPRRFRQRATPPHDNTWRPSMELDRQASVLMKPPPPVLSPRKTPEPNMSRLDDRVPPYMRSFYYADHEPTQSRDLGWRTAGAVENQKNDINTYSSSSSDAYRLSPHMDLEGGGRPYIRVYSRF